ncbi:MAG: T9SS type A sorting domain-containing protein [Gemmatimonadetes bacterium]|nr:T9SS type A sorting domain-containing protein [Gemmatimonadota bacterium]
MNFHKTIGFLAALLLMIGLGAPDSFAQNSINVTVDLNAITLPGVDEDNNNEPDASTRGVLEEVRSTVPVTVTLSPAPAEGVTVEVAVSATLLDGSQIGSTSITAVGDAASTAAFAGTIDITAPRDADADNETAQVTATAAGYASGSIAIPIVDDENTILVAVTPGGGATGFREGTTVTATVAVTLQQNNPGGVRTAIVAGADAFDDAVTVSVSFDPVAEFTKVFDDGTTDDDVVAHKPLKIEVGAGSATGNIAVGATNAELSFIMKDNNNNEGNRDATATASLAGFVNGMTELTLEDDEQTLTLFVDPDKFTEGDAGALAVSVTLVPVPAAATPVTVTATINGIPITDAVADGLSIDTTNGEATGTLTVTLPNDDVNSGDRTIVVSAAFGAGNARVTSNSVNVTVVDDDQDQSLTLTLDPAELREGGNGMVAVTVAFAYRPSTTAATPVTVSATIDGVPVATSQAVEVPANDISVATTLTISLPDDDVDSGTREVVVAAVTGVDAPNATPPTQRISTTETLIITDDDVGPDAFTLSSDISNLQENAPGRNVEVTATLSDDLNAGVTVVVTLTHEIMGDEATATAVSVSGPITIVGPETTGSTMVNIDPSNDEVFTNRSVVLTGSALGLGTGKVTIGIIDDDSSLGTLTATTNPPSLNKANTAQTTTVKVAVQMRDLSASSGMVTVTLETDKGTFRDSGAKTIMLAIPLADDPNKDPATVAPKGSGTTVLEIPGNVANAGGKITVTASADSYVMSTLTIPVGTRTAGDVKGFRVVITAPGAANTWVPVKNNAVTIQVRRVEGIAFPWTNFTSIKVSLRDTASADEAHAATGAFAQLGNVLTLSGISEKEGGFNFRKAGSGGGIAYVAAQDAFQFKLQVPANKGPVPGHYFGVYAIAEFAHTGGPTTLASNDIDTMISDDPAALNEVVPNAAERTVGDGKYIRIDNRKPTAAAVSNIAVTIDGVPIDGSNVPAVVDDEIRVAVKVSASGNVFRNKARLELKTTTANINGINHAGQAAPAKGNFSSIKVNQLASDSLRYTWTVTDNLFKRKIAAFVEGIGNKDTVYPIDSGAALVSVVIIDQAGNTAAKNSPSFPVDSKKPSISFLYPSADPDSAFAHDYNMRFTGNMISTVEGQNVDDHLNPLRIAVNEDLSKIEVFAVGADTLEIGAERQNTFASGAVMDSIVISTTGLSSPKKDEKDKYEGTDYIPSSANIAGTEIEVAVIVTDLLGNKMKATMSGVTHDDAPPKITEWFPKNRLLDDDQINDATRHPVLTLKESVDSIAVNFTASDGDIVKEEVDDVREKGETQVTFSDGLNQDEAYSMTIFLRDLAGNVFITPADSSANMTFNAGFDNPMANMFKVTNMTAITETNETAADSVIAGQAFILEIQTVDHDAASNTSRDALIYKNIDEDGTMAAEVRISAWGADGAAESVWFEGKGVMDDADNPDGMATLDDNWVLGKRTVMAKSNMALDQVKILVEHRNAGDGGTTVPKFDGAIENLYVGAADFAGFEITAWEEGVEGAAQEIWGDYTLRVVPIDEHGNASVRAFKADPETAEDSLAVLDTRVKDNAFEYKNGIPVEIDGVPSIEDFALVVEEIEKGGNSYDLVAPDNRRSQTVRVKVYNEDLMEGDTRSQNIRSSVRLAISAPLTPTLTLWVPGSNVNEAGNDVEIPADGDVTVTVAAEGYNAGDMVTFTKNGTAMDPVAADDDGVARLMITMAAAGTVTVSASNGVYLTDELTVTFVEAPAELSRKKFVDANGDPVYLVSLADMTVGSDDYALFSAAWGKTRTDNPDDQSVFQSDVNDDDTVNSSDYALFITSWGKTAVGPATKPIVLAPGINENAEFSLSLGSERVVAGELVAVDVSLANVAALMAYGFTLNYETDKFEFVSVAPADEDLLKSTGGETPLFHHIVADGQVEVVNSVVHGTAVSGGGDIVRFVFRVLREFEDSARFEIADGLVFDPSQLQNPAVVAGVLELQSTPREFALHQNFPNPFNPDTTIKYDLAESADVTLQVYNVLGQVVRTLVASEAQNAGRYQIRWNGMDDRGVPVSSGIYFYQISADGKFSDVRKLMLLK